jgi:hypothetical protein
LDILCGDALRPTAPVLDAPNLEVDPSSSHCFTTRHWDVFSMAPLPASPTETIDEIEQKCERLSGFLSNSLHIIDHIANSGDLQNSLDIYGSSRSDFQSSLFRESARIEKFLSENGYAITDFALRPDATSISELQTALQQSQTVNGLLTRHTAELRNQLEFVLVENNKLRFQLHEAIDLAPAETPEPSSESSGENELIARIQRVIARPEIDFRISGRIERRISESVLKFLNQCGSELQRGETLSQMDAAVKQATVNLLQQIHALFPEQDGFVTDSEIVEEMRGLLGLHVTVYEPITLSESPAFTVQEERIVKLKKVVACLKGKVNELMQVAEQQTAEAVRNATELQDVKESLHIASNQVCILEARVTELTDELRESNAAHASQSAEVVAEFEQKLQCQLEELKKEKETEIEQLQTAGETERQAIEKAHRTNHRILKKQVRTLSGQLSVEQQRCETVKSHYESLLAELNAQVAASRQKEAAAVSKTTEVQLQFAECQAEISKLNVTVRVTHLKLKASEEKTARIESTLEMKHRIAIAKLESETDARIEALRIEHRNDLSRVFVADCRELNDFCDFSRPITEKTVFETLDRAVRSYQTSHTLIDHLKQEFEVDDGNELRYAIAQRISHAVVPVALPEPREVRHIQIDPEWQVWANRIAVLITGRVSVGLNQTQLQNLIEESVLHSVGSRSLWKTVDRLRIIRRLLESDLGNITKVPTRARTFRGLIAVLIAACRMQRLSGHKRGEFPCDSASLSNIGLEETSPRPCFPIISVCKE